MRCNALNRCTSERQRINSIWADWGLVQTFGLRNLRKRLSFSPREPGAKNLKR